MAPQINLRLLVVTLFLTAACAARLAPVASPSSSLSELDFPPVSISEPPSTTNTHSFGDQPTRFEDLPFNLITANGQEFASVLGSVGTNPIVSKICDNTDHVPLCLATVLPFVKDQKSVNVESVLKVAVNAGSLFAEEALSVTKKLLSKPNTPKELKDTLTGCKDGYDIAVENFGKTVDAFATSDVGTMRTMLSAVITYVGDCEDAFTEMQTQSPLSGYAEKLTDMTSNCLAITEQMMNVV